MLYWLLYLKLFHYFPPFRIFRYLTFRTAFASLTALFTGLPPVDEALIDRHFKGATVAALSVDEHGLTMEAVSP